ncbi:MAG: Hsp20/alpha crystallin family protein [Bacteriovoracia bacterium]
MRKDIEKPNTRNRWPSLWERDKDLIEDFLNFTPVKLMHDWYYPDNVPACDLEERANHFLLNLDMPGIPKENIDIKFENNQISIKGERKQEHHEEENGSYERYSGTYQRTISLPQNIDPDKAEASYENGVLTIAVPKTQASKAKKIDIHEGKNKLLEKVENKKEKKVA